MEVEDNIDTVKRAYVAFRHRNLRALLECLSDDVSWCSVSPPDVVSKVTSRRGYNQVERYLATDDASEEIQQYCPREIIAEGARVVAIGELQRKGEPTTIADTPPWVHIFTLRQGKIVEFRAFYNTDSAIEALANMHVESNTGSSPAGVKPVPVEIRREKRSMKNDHRPADDRNRDNRNPSNTLPPTPVARGKESAFDSGVEKKKVKPGKLSQSATASRNK
jgi:uncharacterized protein